MNDTTTKNPPGIIYINHYGKKEAVTTCKGSTNGNNKKQLERLHTTYIGTKTTTDI